MIRALPNSEAVAIACHASLGSLSAVIEELAINSVESGCEQVKIILDMDECSFAVADDG